MSDKTCWVLTDEKPGNENPCRGLAEAVGLETTIKRVYPRAPWSRLPPQLWFAPLRAPGPGSDALAPPWPDLLIAAGRQTVALSIAIRRRSGKRIFSVQVLNPAVGFDNFDLVVAPQHDHVSGGNVITTLGAMNRVTTVRLAAAARDVATSVKHLPYPRIAVLLGGNSKRHSLDTTVAAEIGDRLAGFARSAGAGLMVTPSRRTGDDNAAALRARLDVTNSVMWDGQGDNPYFGYLAQADAIVVTGDSVAMVSEACTTGKPVYIVDLPGGSEKFREFHENLRRAGYVRPFSGAYEHWEYAPLRETEYVAAEVRRRMKLG